MTVATFPFLNYGDSCNILFFIIPFFISLKKGNVATVTVIHVGFAAANDNGLSFKTGVV